MKLADCLIDALMQFGAREIFGLPGDFALPLFKAIEARPEIPLYTLSHEPAVGFAADAAARISGRPSVAAVTYGAGGINILNAVANAYAEKSPVMVLSGGPGRADSGTGLLIHHQAKTLRSQLSMFTQVTCAQTVLDDLSSAAQDIADTLNQCVLESRPVYIEAPRDLVEAELTNVSVAASTDDETDNRAAIRACAREMLGQIGRAREPVLLVGIEIRRFGVEVGVAELAKALQIPVVTTFMGRGLLSDSASPVLGTYLGAAGASALTALVEESDCLVSMGAILSDTNFGVSESRIDFSKGIVIGDGAVTLNHHHYEQIPLSDLVPTLLDELKSGHFPERPSRPDHAHAEYPRGLGADDSPLKPVDIATGINDLFDAHGMMPMSCDIGDCLFSTLSIVNTELVAPAYYATMGYGVPGGIGIQAATGRRPLVLVGDGAFQMTGWELLNCARLSVDPIVVVFNNASWEMLRTFQPGSKFNDLVELDFSEIATTLGGDGYRVTNKTELAAALSRAYATRGRFQLIDAVLARGDLAPALQNFVDGIKRMRAAG